MEKVVFVLQFMVLLCRRLIQEVKAYTACKFQKKKVCSFWGKNDLELQRQVVFIAINCCRFIVFCYAPPDLSLSSFFFLNVHCFSPLVRAIFCHPVLEQGPYFICSNYCSNSGYLHLLPFSFLKGKKKNLKFQRLTLHRKYDKLQEQLHSGL